MSSDPLRELAVRVNSYLEENRESLPDQDVELLEDVLRTLRDIRQKPPDSNNGVSWPDVVSMAIRLMDFVTDGAAIEKLSNLL